MKTIGKPRRKRLANGLALGLSTGLHIVILVALLDQGNPIYNLPEPIAPPLDVQIIAEPIVPIERIVVPRIKIPAPPKASETPPPVTTPPAPTPSPPRPAPPVPTPAQPPSPQPAPAKPLTPPPTPTPNPRPQPPVPAAPKIAPVAPPNPEPKAVAVAPKTSSNPAPPKPATPPSPTTVTAPVHLNVRKSEKDAPANVATLPMAPAPSPGGAPASGGAPNLGAPIAAPGSRLIGLTPYPLGMMPSGGSGLRGTLVGCANADAVSLSPAEKARCNERFGREAAMAPRLDGISPTKRAAFDKAADRQDAERNRGPPRDPPFHDPGGIPRGPGSVIPSKPLGGGP